MRSRVLRPRRSEPTDSKLLLFCGFVQVCGFVAVPDTSSSGISDPRALNLVGLNVRHTQNELYFASNPRNTGICQSRRSWENRIERESSVSAVSATDRQRVAVHSRGTHTKSEIPDLVSPPAPAFSNCGILDTSPQISGRPLLWVCWGEIRRRVAANQCQRTCWQHPRAASGAYSSWLCVTAPFQVSQSNA